MKWRLERIELYFAELIYTLIGCHTSDNTIKRNHQMQKAFNKGINEVGDQGV